MSALIECRGLSKKYGNQKALNNLSFEIQAGPPIALVGPNGAGKSTLLSILSGYIKASSGDVRVFGHAVGSYELIGRIGALPQDALFDPDITILKQLNYLARLQGFSWHEAKIEAERCLDLMQLISIKDEKINALSHGMKKRVSIAQALMGQPKLILLDEPTAGLDPENARNIRQKITDLSDQTTFIVSSHNLSELEKMCTQVVYLEHGELKSFQAINGAEVESFSHSDIHSEEIKIGFLTLTLKQKLTSLDLVNKIEALNSVLKVEEKQDNEFIIQYHQESNPTLDQDLLKLLAKEAVEYRQIIQGRSLEDQLFNSSAS